MVLVGGVLEGLNYICMYVIHGGGDGGGVGKGEGRVEGEGRGVGEGEEKRGGGRLFSPLLLFYPASTSCIDFHTGYVIRIGIGN